MQRRQSAWSLRCATGLWLTTEPLGPVAGLCACWLWHDDGSPICFCPLACLDRIQAHCSLEHVLMLPVVSWLYSQVLSPLARPNQLKPLHCCLLGCVLLQVQWFERRGSLPPSVGATMHEAEVVESDLIDTNLVGCLDSKATIVTANSYDEVRLYEWWLDCW